MQHFDLNTDYYLCTLDGIISPAGKEDIHSLIRARELPALPENWQWRWMIQRGEYRGTFPARISQYYYRVHGITIDDDLKTAVGNTARSYSSERAFYRFEFVNRIDWEAGDYGDDGSCYWTFNTGGRYMLQENGGMAMRFHTDDGHGYARAWLVEIEDGLYILFNGYGFRGNSTLMIAAIFAAFTGLNYKRIALYADGRSLDINSNAGYIVGKPEEIAHYEDYTIEWENIYMDVCYECHTAMDEDALYYGPDDHHYCEHCFSELFDSCEICGEDHFRDDVYYIDHAGKYGKYVCRYCRASDFDVCEDCEDWYPKGDLIHTDDAVYCPNCYTPPETEESED